MAGRRGDDDVTMTSQQVLLPDDMSDMTSMCADDDDVSVCLRMVAGSRHVLPLYIPGIPLVYIWKKTFICFYYYFFY